MTNPLIVVPAIPPRPPQLSLIKSAIRPTNASDPNNPVWEIGADQLAMLPDDLRLELEARRGESWVRGFTYAPESHDAAELRDACDFTSVDLPALPAPTAVAGTGSITGGTLAADTYEYVVTAVNANGETEPSTEGAGTVASGTTGSIAVTWDDVPGATAYSIYGRQHGSLGLLHTFSASDPDEPLTWTDTGAVAPGVAAPVTNTTGGPGSYTNLPPVEYIPYLIVVEDSCSTFGFEERDFKGRALRLLDSATPQAIEREFWTGTMAAAAGYPNNWLTNPSSVVDLTPGGGPPTASRGLQILQDALAGCGFGGQGMIHVQAQTAPNLLGARRVGSLLLDIFDNIIVPGVGYPGLGPSNAVPAAGTAWMYATDLVAVRSEDEGTVIPESFAEATDWGQGDEPNTIRFRAMRFAAAYFDGACHFGVRVSLSS